MKKKKKKSKRQEPHYMPPPPDALPSIETEDDCQPGKVTYKQPGYVYGGVGHTVMRVTSRLTVQPDLGNHVRVSINNTATMQYASITMNRSDLKKFAEQLLRMVEGA